jgi:hypothetical protein
VEAPSEEIVIGVLEDVHNKGFQLSAFSSRLSAIGCQLSAVGYQLTSFELKADS